MSSVVENVPNSTSQEEKENNLQSSPRTNSESTDSGSVQDLIDFDAPAPKTGGKVTPAPPPVAQSTCLLD